MIGNFFLNLYNNKTPLLVVRNNGWQWQRLESFLQNLLSHQIL